MVVDIPDRPIHKSPKRVMKKVAKDMIMPYRRLTSAGRIMPEFIIIGAQKCGTTSLYRYLAGHPQVIRSFKKEIDYFDLHYERGIHWYRSHFPYSLHRRWRTGVMSRRCLTGEASTNYIVDPLAPARAAQILPSVRLVALLRNPVERAFSHYRHRVRYWQESRTFPDAIASEMDVIEREGHRRLLAALDPEASRFRRRSYLLKGIYANQLTNWQEHFSSGQILVLGAEELYSSPRATFARVVEFLGLEPWNPAGFDAHNSFSYGSMGGRSRDCLAEFFEPHNERLYELLGGRFEWE